MNEGRFSGGNNQEQIFDLPSIVAAAHEMKTPLSLMRQLALELEMIGLNDPVAEDLVNKIRLTAERALRTTSNITRSQRLETSLFPLEPVNLLGVCNEVSYTLRPLFAAQGRQLSVKHRRNTPLVIGNRELLTRILTNFADNALRSGDENDIVEFNTSVSKKSGRIRLSVRDYGPGVSTDVWKKLAKMQPNFQKIERRPDSSGLGLYLSTVFASFMNGKIGVVRHSDGASFFIELRQSRQLSLL